MEQNKHKQILHTFLSVLVPLALGGAVAGGTVFVLKTVGDELRRDPDTSPITYDDQDDSGDALFENDSMSSDEVDEESGEKAEISEKDLPDSLPTTMKDNYKPSEVAFEKKITVSEKISFSTQTLNETNLPRGKTVVSQKGVDGAKKITYLVKYNSVGESLAIDKVSEEITKAPVTQIEKVGVSDYDLNENIAVTNYASGYCLPEDVGPNGCDKAAKSYQFATAFEIKGIFFVTQILTSNGWKTLFSKVSNGSFSYAGELFVFETRHVAGTEELTENFCKAYGFACGRW